MLVPNVPPATPDWHMPTRCRCDCKCAAVTTWPSDQRRACGCCGGSCSRCVHGLQMPDLYVGDQA